MFKQSALFFCEPSGREMLEILVRHFGNAGVGGKISGTRTGPFGAVAPSGHVRTHVQTFVS